MTVQSNFPNIKPSLNLDFANTKRLDPRITFTRASTATYWDGVTQAKAEENLLKYSQDFENASWVKATTTVTANSFAAPDGTTTAETLTADGANSTVLQTFTAAATAYTFSVWLYRKTGTGDVDISVDGTTWATQTLTAGWTRFTTTLTPSAGSKTAGVRLVTSGDEVYTWGAQLEQRSQATAYTPTTDQPITKYQPVLKTAASGVPRFDHNPVTGESLGLLIEEQRTNLLTYSGSFDDAAWTKTEASVGANAAAAPDGTLTAQKLIESTAEGAVHGVSQPNKTTTDVVYTLSAYVKASERSWVYLNDIQSHGVYFDIAGKSSGATVGNPSNIFITDVGNGWLRIGFTCTAANSSAGLNVSIGESSGDRTYTGNGYSGIYLWGAQLEKGSFPTSYIPTTSEQVTRAADDASMTGANFSSWYRQGEGTLFAQARTQFTNASSTNSDLVEANDGTQANYFGTAAGLTQGYQADQLVSVAANGVSRARNGVIAARAQPTNKPPKTTLQIGIGRISYRTPGWYKRIAYYPKRLTDAELQALTA